MTDKKGVDRMQACRMCGKMMVKIPAFNPFADRPIWFCTRWCSAIFDEEKLEQEGPQAIPECYLVLMSPEEKEERDESELE